MRWFRWKRSPKDDSASTDAGFGELAPGQVWIYDTREGEETSRAIILLIEHGTRHGDIAHIALRNVRISNPGRQPPVIDVVGHLPIAEEHARASLRVLEGAGPVPEFRDGYQQWKDDQGGVWTIPLKEVVSALEQALASA